mgnify:CR=1 FL=1
MKKEFMVARYGEKQMGFVYNHDIYLGSAEQNVNYVYSNLVFIFLNLEKYNIDEITVTKINEDCAKLELTLYENKSYCNFVISHKDIIISRIDCYGDILLRGIFKGIEKSGE